MIQKKICPCCGRQLGGPHQMQAPPDGMPDGPYYGTSLDPPTTPIPHSQTVPQKEPSGFHPALYIMAAASITGVLIEYARYRREQKTK